MVAAALVHHVEHGLNLIGSHGVSLIAAALAHHFEHGLLTSILNIMLF